MTNDKISKGQVREAMKQADVASALNRKYGEGNWGFAEVADYIAQQKVGTRPDLAEGIVDDQPPPPPQEAEEPKQDEGPVLSKVEGPTFQETFDRYMTFFDHPEPQDIASIRRLAQIEVQIDTLTRRMARPSSHAEGMIKHLNKLSEMHLKIQQSLGIDRATRAQKFGGEMDVVLKYRDKAKQLLDERGIAIICPHCLSEEAKVDIDQGFIVFHFRHNVAWRWESTCPRCGKIIVLDGPHEIEHL